MLKFKQLASVAAAAVSLAFVAAPATATPTIGFGAAVANGTNWDVDVVVDGLAGDIVSAYDIDVEYDAVQLSFVNWVFSVNLGFPLVDEILDASVPGLVDIYSVSWITDENDILALQGGSSVVLGTLTFTGTDFSSLAFVNWGPTNDVKGRGNKVIIPGGQIPEPATYGLVGLALLAAGVARRRQV